MLVKNNKILAKNGGTEILKNARKEIKNFTKEIIKCWQRNKMLERNKKMLANK